MVFDISISDNVRTIGQSKLRMGRNRRGEVDL